MIAIIVLFHQHSHCELVTHTYLNKCTWNYLEYYRVTLRFHDDIDEKGRDICRVAYKQIDWIGGIRRGGNHELLSAERVVGYTRLPAGSLCCVWDIWWSLTYLRHSNRCLHPSSLTSPFGSDWAPESLVVTLVNLIQAVFVPLKLSPTPSISPSDHFPFSASFSCLADSTSFQ